MSLPSQTAVLTKYNDILNREDIKRLMEIFDLQPFPIEQMNRLTPGQPYDIYLVYERLKTLKLINCDIDFFRQMITMTDGFHVSGDNVFRNGRRQPEINEDIPDPEAE